MTSRRGLSYKHIAESQFVVWLKHLRRLGDALTNLGQLPYSYTRPSTAGSEIPESVSDSLFPSDLSLVARHFRVMATLPRLRDFGKGSLPF